MLYQPNSLEALHVYGWPQNNLSLLVAAELRGHSEAWLREQGLTIGNVPAVAIVPSDKPEWIATETLAWYLVHSPEVIV